MRIYLAGIIVLGALAAGCSSEREAARDATTNSAMDASGEGGLLPVGTLASRDAAVVPFASLPDRGELLSYRADREVQRRGAYTSHPIEISEAHALNAIGTGSLRLNTPDGKPVEVAFERIEEHPDGNWSWVGQTDGGTHAVLTFGERAVFGEIAVDGRSYRVTTRGGSGWIVESDPTLLAGNRPQHHGDGPEFLIPPSALESGIGIAGAKATPAATAGVPTKATGAVVDLALGYTNGMVAAYGNQSATVTRLTNLVALGNSALQRSGVNMRVRLVHTLNVNFPDNTDNVDALQKLTGYNATTRQQVTPDPAFNALRAAREEFGADLVSLVRPHRSPEQRGCGIAWLIGANQTPIVPAQDAAFGYSVVSDGSDEDEGDGNTYYCSEYSLIHELGHNLGQAHNQSDSDDSGAHTYSYGYRETSSTGFHTIMAYPLENSSQTEIAYFATPLINYAAGRPMGVANASDNVRSLNQTMPVIAAFRATVVPLGGVYSDFDGDGKSDILWRNFSSGANLYWRSGNNSQRKQLVTVANMAWVVSGVGDFDGDGKTDILWRNTSNDRVQLWPGADQSKARNMSNVSNRTWQVAGVGDFNSDGRDDILWRHASNGRTLFWSSGNSSTQVELHRVTDMTWQIVGVGDFDRDGYADILWRNTASGRNLYYGRGLKARQVNLHTVTDQNWRVAGVGDFNGDGRDDVLWRHRVSGRMLYYGGGNKSEQVNLATVADQNWQVMDVGDYNGDGRADILWRHRTSGRNLYYGGGNKAEQVNLDTVTGNTWRIVP